MSKPIRALFGVLAFFFYLLMLPHIPAYWAEPWVIGFVTIIFLWFLSVALLSD